MRDLGRNGCKDLGGVLFRVVLNLVLSKLGFIIGWNWIRVKRMAALVK